jgi:hypothetical protein
VPADDKDFAHFVVAEALIRTLEKLDLKMPLPSASEAALLDEARHALERE